MFLFFVFLHIDDFFLCRRRRSWNIYSSLLLLDLLWPPDVFNFGVFLFRRNINYSLILSFFRFITIRNFGFLTLDTMVWMVWFRGRGGRRLGGTASTFLLFLLMLMPPTYNSFRNGCRFIAALLLFICGTAAIDIVLMSGFRLWLLSLHQ